VEEVGVPEGDGWVSVQMLFELREDALAFALSFGPALEVVEPLELRQEVMLLAQQMVERYRRRS
jgi:predicted DNA-binding transcriptional regulator YafY